MTTTKHTVSNQGFQLVSISFVLIDMSFDPEIGFGFVSCSCRACERAGEAKLCGRVREECLSTLGLRMERCPPTGDCVLGVFVAMLMGFKIFWHGLLIFSYAF